MQRYRELQRAEREHAKVAEKMRIVNEKEAEKLRCAHEVSRFENYLDLLVSVHKECGEAWDWHALANMGPPRPPERAAQHEAAAVAALDKYRPSFLEKLFGGEKKRRAALAEAVMRARASDDAAHGEAMRAYQAAHAAWHATASLAPRVLARDPSVYEYTLQHGAAFEELVAFRTHVALSAAEPDAVVLVCNLTTDDDLVPGEEVKLTAAGKLSTKPMPAGRYWSLYQDHVCSCALRAANEAFAVLPVSRVIVNIGAVQTNTRTGHQEFAVFLAAHFVRAVFTQLNLDKIDPSDSLRNFPHRMKFKKTAGFEPVLGMTLEEQWVTT